MCPFSYIILAIAAIALTILFWSHSIRKSGLDCQTVSRLLRQSTNVHPKHFTGGIVDTSTLDLLLSVSSSSGSTWRYIVIKGPKAIRKYLSLLPSGRDEADSATFANVDVEEDLKPHVGKMSHLVLITSLSKEGGEVRVYLSRC